MDLEHPAARGHDAHRLEQARVGQPEVEDHERLRGRDARIDGRRQLGERIVAVAADGEAQPVVDRAVAVGRGAPLADAGQQRALGRGRRARARVVERQERRRPAERRRDRILEEPVRMGVGGDARVGVDVDRRPGSTSSPVASITSSAAAAGPDRSGSMAVDPPAGDRDIGQRDPVAVTTVPPRMIERRSSCAPTPRRDALE